MHWLEQRISRLQKIVERQEEYQKMDAAQLAGAAGAARKVAREEFIRDISALVREIAHREGVMASFACHEGLLVESAGIADDFEALAAVGQNLLRVGVHSFTSLSFGGVSQMVIIGDDMKLALFSMGQIGIGITARRDANLSKVLS